MRGGEAREDDTTQTFYPEPNLSLIVIRQTGEQGCAVIARNIS